MATISTYLRNELRQIPFNLFEIISDYLDSDKSVKIAFVGGYIRDLLIKKIHQNSTCCPIDLDIVVEGSALELAKYIKKNLSDIDLCLIKEFEVYKTVEININNLKIDIATARKETYLSPGLNPSVEDSTITEDLKRRDFSINSLAYEMRTEKLYDLFDGTNHIKQKELHLLHKKSISDDPSRILRCAKYASRFDFKISDLSLSQAQKTIGQWPWKSSKKNIFPPGIGIRMRMELAEIIRHDDISKIITKLYQWDVISIINKDIKLTNKFSRGLTWIKRLDGSIILYLLKDSDSLDLLCERFLLNKKEKKILDEYKYIKNLVNSNKKDFRNLSPSNWTDFIESHNLQEETVKLIICDGIHFWRAFFKWLFLYRFIKSNKNGDQLKKEGWIQGKDIGKEIKRLRYLEIDKLR